MNIDDSNDELLSSINYDDEASFENRNSLMEVIATDNTEEINDDRVDDNTDMDNSDDTILENLVNDDNYESNDKSLSCIKKIKKPMSSWLIFLSENREIVRKEHPHLTFKEIAQSLSERYKHISDEDRSRLQLQAEQEKKRYLEDLQSSSENIKEIPQFPVSSARTSNSELFLPLARVKKTMKIDPSVSKIQKNCIISVAKATEFFLQYMSRRAHQISLSRRSGGKSVRLSDVIQAIHTTPSFEFLVPDFPKSMAPEILKSTVTNKRKITNETGKSVDKSDTSPRGSITNFFGKTKNAEVIVESEADSDERVAMDYHEEAEEDTHIEIE